MLIDWFYINTKPNDNAMSMKSRESKQVSLSGDNSALEYLFLFTKLLFLIICSLIF